MGDSYACLNAGLHSQRVAMQAGRKKLLQGRVNKLVSACSLHCCAGRKTRYTYVVTYEYGDGFDRPYGLAKIDLAASSPAAAVAAQIGFGRGRSGGEAVFVPSSTDPAALKSAQTSIYHESA